MVDKKTNVFALLIIDMKKPVCSFHQFFLFETEAKFLSPVWCGFYLSAASMIYLMHLFLLDSQRGTLHF